MHEEKKKRFGPGARSALRACLAALFIPAAGSLILLLLTAASCDASYRARFPLPKNLEVGRLTRIGPGSFYLPAGFTPEKKYPLIVLLHGLSQTGESFFYSNSFREQADARGYILCAPRSEQTFWNEDITSPDIETIRNLIMVMRAYFPIREDKICVLGFSAGSHFTHTMLLFNRIPWSSRRLFTAFIAGSGGSGFMMDQYREHHTFPPDLEIPGYIFWGRREVPHPGEEMAGFLRGQGWDITTYEHAGHHSLDGRLVSLAFDWLDKKIP
jgi:predicted esterase